MSPECANLFKAERGHRPGAFDDPRRQRPQEAPSSIIGTNPTPLSSDDRPRCGWT
jgi:hypothetical protein